MTCVHLRQLYKLCEENDLKLSSSDLIRVACSQCGEQEVCPGTMTDEYEARLNANAQQAEQAEPASDTSSTVKESE